MDDRAGPPVSKCRGTCLDSVTGCNSLELFHQIELNSSFGDGSDKDRILDVGSSGPIESALCTKKIDLGLKNIFFLHGIVSYQVSSLV